MARPRPWPHGAPSYRRRSPHGRFRPTPLLRREPTPMSKWARDHPIQWRTEFCPLDHAGPPPRPQSEATGSGTPPKSYDESRALRPMARNQPHRDQTASRKRWPTSSQSYRMAGAAQAILGCLDNLEINLMRDLRPGVTSTDVRSHTAPRKLLVCVAHTLARRQTCVPSRAIGQLAHAERVVPIEHMLGEPAEKSIMDKAMHPSGDTEAVVLVVLVASLCVVRFG